RLASRMEVDEGVVTLEARLHAWTPPGRVVLSVAGQEANVDVRPHAGTWLLRAAVRLSDPPLWWPHSHGPQPLSPFELHLGRDRVPCGAVGFRRLRVEQGDGFSVHVNDTPVYCRGACWTVSDVLSPGEALERDLRLARDAGANMLRVGGTMVYE